MSDISAFGIYSCINETPRIHRVVSNLTVAHEKLLEYVHLLTKNQKSEEKSLSSDSVYPNLSYKILENKQIEIYEHNQTEKVERGWVWNAKSSQIETKKIGVFQVIEVENPIEIKQDLQPTPVEEIKITQDKETDTNDINVEMQVNKLLDQVLDTICNMKIEDMIEKDIDLKDIDNHSETIQQDNESTTADYINDQSKRQKIYESLFVPFFDQVKETTSSANQTEDEELAPPVWRLSTRGQRCKRRYPSTSTRYGNRY